MYEVGRDTAAFVAVDPDVGAIGFFTCGPGRCQGAGRRATIYTLFILSECQRIGIGTHLAGVAREWLVAGGPQSMVVWVLVAHSTGPFCDRTGVAAVLTLTICVGGHHVQDVRSVWYDLAAFAEASGGGAAQM